MEILAVDRQYASEILRVLTIRSETDAGFHGLGEIVYKIPGSKGVLHDTLFPLLMSGNIRYIV